MRSSRGRRARSRRAASGVRWARVECTREARAGRPGQAPPAVRQRLVRRPRYDVTNRTTPTRNAASETRTSGDGDVEPDGSTVPREPSFVSALGPGDPPSRATADGPAVGRAPAVVPPAAPRAGSLLARSDTGTGAGLTD